MCLIVDANLLSIMFKKTSDTDYQKLRDAIFSNRLTIVHGGFLTKEYSKVAEVLAIVSKLSQSGKAIKIKTELIDAHLAYAKKHCLSNDHHVIALGRADRKHAHVLCTKDTDLRTDFKNKTLIDNPRGTIYSPSRHKQSLANC